MAFKTRAQLKAYFELDDHPTEGQFGEFIDSLRHVWEDYTYAGVAVVATVPTATNRNIFYLASVAGTYSNFGALVVLPGELAVLKNTVNPITGIGTWTKDSIGFFIKGTSGTFTLADVTAGVLTATYTASIVRPLQAIITLAAGGETIICPVTKINATSCSINVGEVPTGTHTYDLIYYV